MYRQHGSWGVVCSVSYSEMNLWWCRLELFIGEGEDDGRDLRKWFFFFGWAVIADWSLAIEKLKTLEYITIKLNNESYFREIKYFKNRMTMDQELEDNVPHDKGIEHIRVIIRRIWKSNDTPKYYTQSCDILAWSVSEATKGGRIYFSSTNFVSLSFELGGKSTCRRLCQHWISQSFSITSSPGLSNWPLFASSWSNWQDEHQLTSLRCTYLCALSIPVVQVSHTSAQVSRESQPGQVWSKSVSRDRINLAPDVSQVSGNTRQCYNVDCGLNRSLGPEKKWHPCKVEAELDCVESSALLCEEVFLKWGSRCHAGRIGAVGSVAHKTV